MTGGIEIVHLFAADAVDGVGIHHHLTCGVGLPASDACRGNEMGVGRQLLLVEHLVARPYHARIVIINIVYKEPGAYAVALQRQSFLAQALHVAVQYLGGLGMRALLLTVGTA